MSDNDKLEENYARAGRALDKILALDGVDLHADVDLEPCYTSDEDTELSVKLVVDNEVFDDE